MNRPFSEWRVPYTAWTFDFLLIFVGKIIKTTFAGDEKIIEAISNLERDIVRYHRTLATYHVFLTTNIGEDVQRTRLEMQATHSEVLDTHSDVQGSHFQIQF